MDDSPQVETVETALINVENENNVVSPNDYGEVPILTGDTLSERKVVTNRDIVLDRQSKLESLRNKLDNTDMLTKRNKKNRLKDKIEDVEESVVLWLSNVENADKRSITAEVTGLPVETVDKRLLTSLILADQHDLVSNITFMSNGVKIHLEDGFVSATGVEIELVSVGDTIVVQGRCDDGEQKSVCTFPDTYLQENDVLTTVNRLLGGVGWNV